MKPEFGIFNTFAAVPIPPPKESLNQNKKWIDWGIDNLYPMFLINTANKSSLHSSILKQKAMFIGGQGWSKTNLSMEASLMLGNYYNEDDCDELLFKIAMDLELYGGFYLNLIWSRDRKSISEINYIDPSKVRIAQPDPTQKYPQTENYWISDGWENTRKYEPIYYQGFSTVNQKERSQILYVKEYRPGTEWYARPEYEPGIRWIQLEWSISNWHLNNVENGFAPDMHINYPIGQPGSEEVADTIRRLKAQFEGSDNAGRKVVTFSQDKESAPTFEAIELNQTDARFLMLNDHVTDGILKAHRVVDPELFGIKTPGQMGSSGNSIVQSLEIFSTQYLEPKQRLIEKVFNWLARINGIEDRLLINKYQPQFSKIQTNISDILSILSEKNVTPQQKYYLLLANDYDHNTAANLSDYHEGNNLKDKNNIKK
jgi:hypothetical protein